MNNSSNNNNNNKLRKAIEIIVLVAIIALSVVIFIFRDKISNVSEVGYLGVLLLLNNISAFNSLYEPKRKTDTKIGRMQNKISLVTD